MADGTAGCDYCYVTLYRLYSTVVHCRLHIRKSFDGRNQPQISFQRKPTYEQSLCIAQSCNTLPSAFRFTIEISTPTLFHEFRSKKKAINELCEKISAMNLAKLHFYSTFDSRFETSWKPSTWSRKNKKKEHFSNGPKVRRVV